MKTYEIRTPAGHVVAHRDTIESALRRGRRLEASTVHLTATGACLATTIRADAPLPRVRFGKRGGR